MLSSLRAVPPPIDFQREPGVRQHGLVEQFAAAPAAVISHLHRYYRADHPLLLCWTRGAGFSAWRACVCARHADAAKPDAECRYGDAGFERHLDCNRYAVDASHLDADAHPQPQRYGYRHRHINVDANGNPYADPYIDKCADCDIDGDADGYTSDSN